MTTPARAVFANRDTATMRETDGVVMATLLESGDTAGRSAAEEIDAAPGTDVPIGRRTPCATCLSSAATGC